MTNPAPEAAAPALSIATEDIRGAKHVGRLYHFPGTDVPDLKNLKDIQAGLREGLLVPSVTNVIGALSKPHLINWAAREAAKAAVETLTRNQRLFERARSVPSKAISYFATANERIRDNAGTRGTNIHLACELLGAGQSIDHLELTADEKASADQFKAWLDTFQPTYHYQEVTGFSTTPSGLGSAGTSDFIANIQGVEIIGDYKCTTDDTLILTADGTPVRAADIQEGDMVLAWNAEQGLHPSPVVYAGDNGTHEVITVSTSTGHEVTTTHNHPYWVSRKNKTPQWVMADKIEIGDQVFVPIGWNHSPERKVTAQWPWNRYLSPYLFGMLWALANYSKAGWSEKNSVHELPRIARQSLRDELRDSGFVITKTDRLSLGRGIEKIARKHGVDAAEIRDVLTSPTLPSYLYGADSLVQQGFISGVREVFSNPEMNNDNMFLVFTNKEAHQHLQQYLVNAGHMVNMEEDSQGRAYMRVILDSNTTMKFHGTISATVKSVLWHQEPAHTIALEVAGDHTHVTGGIITHNTNRSGLHDEISLQLAANRHADNLVLDDNTTVVPMPKVDMGLGIHVSPQGILTQEVEAGAEAWETYASLRTAWDFQIFKGYAHGDKKALGRIIKTPQDL